MHLGDQHEQDAQSDDAGPTISVLRQTRRASDSMAITQFFRLSTLPFVDKLIAVASNISRGKDYMCISCRQALGLCYYHIPDNFHSSYPTYKNIETCLAISMIIHVIQSMEIDTP